MSLSFFLASAGWSFIPELMVAGVLRNAVARWPRVFPPLQLHQGLSSILVLHHLGPGCASGDVSVEAGVSPPLLPLERRRRPNCQRTASPGPTVGFSGYLSCICEAVLLF